MLEGRLESRLRWAAGAMRHADGEPGLGLGDRFSAFAERRNDDSFEGCEVGGERFAATPATSSTTACSLE